MGKRTTIEDGAVSVKRPAPVDMDMSVARRSRHWSALGMALGMVASVAGGGSDGLWDDPAFLLYRQALEALDKNDYDRARRLAGEAIRLYPDHALAHHLAGRAAAAQSRWSEAASAFARAATIYPGSSAAHRDLATALAQLGRLEACENALVRAVALRDDPKTWLNLADVRCRLGDFDGARAALGRVAQDPGLRGRASWELARLASLGASSVPELRVRRGFSGCG